MKRPAPNLEARVWPGDRVCHLDQQTIPGTVLRTENDEGCWVLVQWYPDGILAGDPVWCGAACLIPYTRKEPT